MNIVSAMALLILAAIASGLALALALSRASRSRPSAVGVFLIGAVLGALYGGGKPAPHLWRFNYVKTGDYGVYDQGSYCTNDEIRAVWRYDIPVAAYTLRAAYQDQTITNAVGECIDAFHALTDVPVSDGAHTWRVAGVNAENLLVVLYADYVAPPVVHTNGVYHLGGVMRAIESDAKYVTPGIPIRAHGEGGGVETLTPTNAPPSPSNRVSIQMEVQQ